MGDPVGAARHVRAALAPGGAWMIVEPRAGDTRARRTSTRSAAPTTRSRRCSAPRARSRRRSASRSAPRRARRGCASVLESAGFTQRPARGRDAVQPRAGSARVAAAGWCSGPAPAARSASASAVREFTPSLQVDVAQVVLDRLRAEVQRRRGLPRGRPPRPASARSAAPAASARRSVDGIAPPGGLAGRLAAPRSPARPTEPRRARRTRRGRRAAAARGVGARGRPGAAARRGSSCGAGRARRRRSVPARAAPSARGVVARAPSASSSQHERRGAPAPARAPTAAPSRRPRAAVGAASAAASPARPSAHERLDELRRRARGRGRAARAAR